MADQKISQLTELTGLNADGDDLAVVVDVSDTTMSPTGTNKQIRLAEFVTYVGQTVSQGIQGTTGSQGIQGIQGTTGSQGIQGTTGSQGIQGIQGTTGSQGEPGEVTLAGFETLSNKTVVNVVFDGDYTEEVFTITDGASVDLDPGNGTIQLWTLGASRSPTATGFAAGQSMTLMIDDGSAYSITWPSVTWKTNGGVAPTLNTTGYTVVQLWKVGTTLYGARVGDA